MAAFEFSDKGAIASLSKDLATAGILAPIRVGKTVQKFGIILQARVQAKASGRPGPRVQTGDYRRSINVEFGRLGAAVIARVGTNKPQGRRLEFGFTGTDSLGRAYNQPPYPHFGPAFDKTAPEFEQAVSDAAAGTLTGTSIPTTPSIPNRDESGRFIGNR